MKKLIFSALLAAVFGIFAPRMDAQIYAGDFMIIEEASYVTIFSYLGSSYDVVVPSVINNKPVTHIGSNAFQQTGVHSVSLPSSIVSIGDAAFFDCQNLASITIPDSVIEIGYQAFWNCLNLQSAAIGSKVKSIGVEAFEYCENLGEIVIPQSVESIGYNAFLGCKKLKDIVIPDNVTTLGSGAFSGCSSLKTASVGNGVSEIKGYLFSHCTTLETVTVGENISSIGIEAFSYCSALKSLTFPAGVSFIGENAFFNCTSLLSLKFFGDAPEIENPIYYANQSTVYYLEGKSGWGTTFAGRPTAKWSGGANVLPIFTKRTPAADSVSGNEGTSFAFSVAANDSSDPEISERGMDSVTWYLDGVQKLETKTGAPGAISSSYTLKTDASTIQGAASGGFQIKAVALDKQGGTAETSWSVQITNVAAGQTITFKALTPKAPGDADFSPGATASSGLPVEYASSNPEVAEIADGMVRLVGAGTTVITASQPGNLDFKAAPSAKQTLVVKSRVIAGAPGGGGTVTGAGLYAPGSKVTVTAKPLPNYTFLHWEDGSQSPTRTLVLNSSVTTVTAVFKLTADISQAAIEDPGTQICTVGVPFQLPLQIDSESLPTIALSGLPAGLKYDPATRTISGVPTAAVVNKTITVTVKNANKQSSVLSLNLTINALPVWAQGDFGGWFENETLGVGTASMTVTPKGGISGKFVVGGKSYSFLAASFSSFDEEQAQFLLQAVAKCGTVGWPLEIVIQHPGDNPDLSAGFAQAEVVLSGAPDAPSAWLYRNGWKDADMQATASAYAAYYTATLSADADAGSGYLTFTADKVGTLRTVGKLADGTSFTSSLPFLMDENGRIMAVLYISPSGYKGGCFFGKAEFFRADDQSPVTIQMAEGECLWENRDPLATADYEAGGFRRTSMIEGGSYDPGIDFRTAFPEGLVCGGDMALPSLFLPVRISDFNPESMAENPPKISWTEYAVMDASGQSPEGLQITATPATGIGTGLAAPKAGAPVKITDPDTHEWWYEYDAENSCGLTFSVDRKTGKFKGSFNIYYDYVSADDYVTGRQTMSHLVKKVSIEGVLTPVRPAEGDNVAGGGFYLLSDKSSYLNQADREIIYSFTGSHDFLLMDPTVK